MGGVTALSTAIIESGLACVLQLSTSYIPRRLPSFPGVHFPLGHLGSQIAKQFTVLPAQH